MTLSRKSIVVILLSTIWLAVERVLVLYVKTSKWAFLIRICPAFNSLHFLHPLQNHWSNFNKLGNLFKSIQVCINAWECPSSRGDNWEIVKIGWECLKIFKSHLTRKCLNLYRFEFTLHEDVFILILSFVTDFKRCFLIM